MGGFRSLLRADPIEWLLAPDNPSVRYFALTGLLDRPEDDPAVAEARRAIMAAGPVPEILGRQQPGGHWEEADRFYTAKYGGTVWQLMVLAELGADGCEPRIRRACEFILEHSQDRGSGGFSVHRAAKEGGGRPGEVIPCLSGNMVFSLIRLGYLDDPRLQRGVEWIARYQRFDDAAAEAPRGWPYDRYEICWGRHSCHMGAAKALKALAALPEGRRTPETRATIERGVEYFLVHRVHKRSHDPSCVARLERASPRSSAARSRRHA